MAEELEKLLQGCSCVGEPISFLSKVLIPACGGGGLVDPGLPRRVWEPPEAQDRGQGSSQAPLTWQKEESKGLLRCRGGAKGQASPDPGRTDGVGLGLACLGPRWDQGLWGAERGMGCQGSSYLVGWGLLTSSPFGGW